MVDIPWFNNPPRIRQISREELSEPMCMFLFLRHHRGGKDFSAVTWSWNGMGYHPLHSVVIVAQDPALKWEPGLSTLEEISTLFMEAVVLTHREYGNCCVRTQNELERNVTPLMLMAKRRFQHETD